MGVEYREIVDRGAKRIVVSYNNMEETLFHTAAKGGETEVLQKLWELSTEKLSAEELKEFLLAKNDMEQTVFHTAVKDGETKVLQKL